MPVCATGSTVKPGVPAQIHIDPPYAVTILPPEVRWLAPFISFIRPLDINVAAFCAIDAPSFPVIDATDLLNLLSPTRFTVGIVAAEKIIQALHHILWYQLCQCNSPETTPARPTGPAEPTGAPSINPINVVGSPSSVPCASENYNYDNPESQAAFPNGFAINTAFIPVVASTLKVLVRNRSAGASHPSATLRLEWRQGNSITLSQTDQPIPLNTDSEYLFAVDPRANKVSAQILFTGTSTDLWGGRYDYFCGTPPGSTDIALCGPDPRSIALLEQILAMVTLIQRQAVPFAYVPGDEHVALTGAGQIDVQGLIGVKVAPTTLPAHVGYAEGDPDTLWLDSWIRWGGSDGWTERELLRSSPHLSLPKLAGQYTKVGYTLQPGLAVTITELLREP